MKKLYLNEIYNMLDPTNMISYLNDCASDLFSITCNEAIPAQSTRKNKHLKIHTHKGRNEQNTDDHFTKKAWETVL